MGFKKERCSSRGSSELVSPMLAVPQYVGTACLGMHPSTRHPCETLGVGRWAGRAGCRIAEETGLPGTPRYLGRCGMQRKYLRCLSATASRGGLDQCMGVVP